MKFLILLFLIACDYETPKPISPQKGVYLLITTVYSTGSWPAVRAYKMDSMEECLTSLEATLTHVANGGDAEAAVTVTCVSSYPEQPNMR